MNSCGSSLRVIILMKILRKLWASGGDNLLLLISPVRAFFHSISTHMKNETFCSWLWRIAWYSKVNLNGICQCHHVQCLFIGVSWRLFSHFFELSLTCYGIFLEKLLPEFWGFFSIYQVKGTPQNVKQIKTTTWI